MAVLKGNAMLLKVGDGGSPATYSTVAMQETTSIKFNGKDVDISSKDSAGMRELGDGMGLLDCEITANGVVDTVANMKTLYDAWVANAVAGYEMIFDGGDTIEGNFMITSLQFDGPLEDKQTYSITMKSSGALTYTVA